MYIYIGSISPKTVRIFQGIFSMSGSMRLRSRTLQSLAVIKVLFLGSSW